MTAGAHEQRRTPRTALACPVVLLRRRGGPVTGRTEDVGPGGARVVVDRPLGVDEEVEFDLTLGGAHVDGRARVLRQQGLNCYALRFERLDPAAAQALRGAVARAA
jgi:PilZ domain-containing protein